VVRRRVLSRNLVNEEAVAHWGFRVSKKKGQDWRQHRWFPMCKWSFLKTLSIENFVKQE